MSTVLLSGASTPARVERFGAGLVRWSLVFFLVLFGALKWTVDEAQSIQPLIANSPFLGWLDLTLGAQRASEVIGVLELVTALFITLRRWAPRLTMIGGVMSVLMFITTLSFLVTTPNVGPMVGFLMKDLTLLGVAIWITGEAWAADVTSKPRGI
jgi:uncharacterized membrane protein YkgB